MRKLLKPENVPESSISSSPCYQEALAANRCIVVSYGRNPTEEKPALKFPGYNSPSLKQAIRVVASGCCGYCGKRVTGSHTPVVEHYRPKAALYFQSNPFSPFLVSKKVKKADSSIECLFGYYQFGDDANNMIPSCATCNTGQGNSGIYVTKMVDGEKSSGCLDSEVSFGKNNFFPLHFKKGKGKRLSDPRYSLQSVDDIGAERPLLFNPYVDDPEKLFQYKDTGISNRTNQAFIQIRPNRNGSNYQRLKAQASISLLGLNRKELCHDRADKYIRLESLKNEMSVTILSKDWCPSKWGGFSRRYANEFRTEHSSLIGFGKVIDGHLGNLGHQIRSIIVMCVQCNEVNIFTNDDDFFDVINELTTFSAKISENYGYTVPEDSSRQLTDLIFNGN